jgi:hypothetical protein
MDKVLMFTRYWLILGLAIWILWPSIPIAQAGNIVGKVVFHGSIPPLQEFKVTRNADFCGEQRSIQRLHIDPTGGVQNVVLSLEGKTPLPQKMSATELVLNNHDCTFAPHVSTAVVSQMLTIRNDDPLLHNTNIGIGEKTFINVALVEGGSPIKKRLKRPGLMTVECNAHKFMQAYIHVFDHSYFAVSNEAGQFTISEVPSGNYTLSIWHEYLGTLKTAVVVPQNGEISIVVEYPKE